MEEVIESIGIALVVIFLGFLIVAAGAIFTFVASRMYQEEHSLLPSRKDKP